ncbi:YlbG family protein [Pseudalkalibacillus caeni]|uniref:UPF0298 protein FCL54_07435 n=1 Tax=Exobacillus caeni TaxID=2574798 RepID=A0A5R9F3S5_9BACL|nr:DUF2129 domain-containing protein [Pseudalkalibacillus caeni]TLS37651.1 DUF2129 domain-containing protein [Pseudalkalibacillus caeni]
MFVLRRGLAVYIHSLKYAKQLRRYGNVHYVSTRKKYVILYVNDDSIEQTIQKLESLHFVKRIEKSMRPDVKTEYQNAKPDKAKEYDYKMGL